MIQIQNIKTGKELVQVAENWYQRAKKLSSIWQDDNVPIEKSGKAYLLWFELTQRLLKIKDLITELTNLTPKFAPGGYVPDTGEKFVMNEDQFRRGLKPDHWMQNEAYKVINPFANKNI